MARKPKTKAGENRPTPARPAPAVAVDAGSTGQLYFRVGAALTFLVSFVLYVRTMTPSAPFWDAGEFIASAYTLGIPHSPGTPLYVLVGRVFTLLPLPFSIAGKVNFISVLVGSLGAVFVYILVVRFLDHMLSKSAAPADALIKVVGGLVGALFLIFSETYWANTTEAEVYAMSVFFMGFVTWLGLKWSDNPSGARSVMYIYLLFYLLALSVGLHLGTVLAASGVFLLILMTREKAFTNTQFILACIGVGIFIADATLYRNGNVTLVLIGLFSLVLAVFYTRTKSRFAIICSALFLLGISVHLYLLIRSGHNPAIDEADPETWRGLYAVLRREQYPPPQLTRKASFVFQLQHFNDYFQSQFKMASAYLGKLNLGSVIPLGLGIWGMVDQFTKHRKTFVVLFVTFVVVSLGMIVYLNFSADEVRERDYFYLPAFYYFAIFIGIGAGSLLAEIRRFAMRSSMNGMAAVVVPAVVFLCLPLFTARHHFHERDRSRDFVCREYAKNMLVGLDEGAIIFTNGDNDTFPLWYIQEVENFRRDVRVVNLSLLNTPWYLKQLKNNEPKVKMAWTDEEVEALRPMQTTDGRILYVRDLGVERILRDNYGSKPIYFAVTIPPDIYKPYRDIMEMEGLAYRIVPKRGSNMVNVAKLEENIWKNFSYLGLLDDEWKRDETIYHPPFVRRLCQNYSAAFTQLGFMKAQEKNYPEAIKNLEVAEQITPDLDAVVMWLGWYYMENGDSATAVEYYRDHIEREPDNCDYRYRLAGVQERLGDLVGALETLEALINRCRDYREAVVSAVAISLNFNLADRALNYIDNWLASHPGDEAMRRTREELVKRGAPAPDTVGQEP